MIEAIVEQDFYEVLRSRQSIRRYRDETIPDAALRRVLRAAIAAPSAHNRQPWRFVVVTQAAQKERLACAMGDALRADRLDDGDDPTVVEQDVQRSYARITSAPVLFLVSLTMDVMDAYPDMRRQSNEHMMAVQSVAMAAQNLLLSLHAEGLGGCWMCAPLFCRDAVRGALEIPEEWEPQALITAGVPLGPSKSRPRVAMEDVTRFL